MLGRRKQNRDAKADRRGLPRPGLWLNLFLLTIAVSALCFAAGQRQKIDADYARVFDKPAVPSELDQVKAELAEMDLTNESLKKELDSRLAYLESLKAGQFYLSIDTARKKLSLNFGNDTMRETDVQIGPPAVVDGPNGKIWTFVPLKGAFNVEGKETGLPWLVPAWVYALNHQPAPKLSPTIPNGLGKYVILLPNDYVIQSPPARGSPLKGPKPGSFMVSEKDLEAIWDRITPETRVYIF